MRILAAWTSLSERRYLAEFSFVRSWPKAARNRTLAIKRSEVLTMRIAAILIVLSLASGCATYAPGPVPLLGTVLPEACLPEFDNIAEEQKCGDWFYDLGIAAARDDISRTGYYNPNEELLTDEYLLNRFAQGYKDARTTVGAPSMAGY